MLLSVHIPKTAGVSFRKVLAQIYGPGFVQYYWEITDAWGRVRADVPSDATCVHGHFVAHILAEKYPDATLITWVRNPVERVASSYYFRLRNPDWKHPVCVELHEKKLSLLEYAGLELVRNEMTRFFGQKQPADFAFIGLVEEIESSMTVFFDRFELHPVPIPRDNYNPDRQNAYYDLSEGERRQILELNQADWDLYQVCSERYYKELGNHTGIARHG